MRATSAFFLGLVLCSAAVVMADDTDSLSRAEWFAKEMIRTLESEFELEEVECPRSANTTTMICRIDGARSASRFMESWDAHAEQHLSPLTEDTQPGAIITMWDWKQDANSHSKTYAVGMEASVTVIYGYSDDNGLVVIGVALIPDD